MNCLSKAFLVLPFCCGLMCLGQGYHTIDLQLDLTPFPKSQDIVAQIYVNHKFRTSIPADNTSFSRIYKNIPKQKNDSVIEVKLVLYEPKDYVVIDGVPFTYFSGDRRKVKIIERKLAWEGAVKVTKDLMKAGNFSESIKTSSAFLNNNLFRDTKEELELTLMLSYSYAQSGDLALSYQKLEEIPIEKITQLDDEYQKDYALRLLRTFASKVTQNQSGDIVKAPFRFSLAMQISQDEEAFTEWNEVTNKIIGLQALKGLNLALFQSSLRSGLTINEQFTELVNILE